MREIVTAERWRQKERRNNRHAGLVAARDYFYRGPIARRIGDYMQANGGLIAADDFARFHANTGQPVRADTMTIRFIKPASGRKAQLSSKHSICWKILT